eukprot:3612391-Amphidinium_carterae.1
MKERPRRVRTHIDDSTAGDFATGNTAAREQPQEQEQRGTSVATADTEVPQAKPMPRMTRVIPTES